MNYQNIILNSGTISGNIAQNTEQSEAKSKKGNPVNTEHSSQKSYKYDIAISYASEQELYVNRVAKILEKEKINVFYAPNLEDEFLSCDMITAFYDIYRYESLYVACFISEDYLQKDITMHEAKTALIRGKDERRNCLIPVCFGSARLKELDPDIHYIDADKFKEVEVADKLKRIVTAYKNNR